MKLSGQFWAPTALNPGKSPRHPLNRTLCEPQSRSGRCGVREKSFALAGNRTPSIQTVGVPTELFQLLLIVYLSMFYLTTLSVALTGGIFNKWLIWKDGEGICYVLIWGFITAFSGRNPRWSRKISVRTICPGQRTLPRYKSEALTLSQLACVRAVEQRVSV
jgi:hypothetical protein